MPIEHIRFGPARPQTSFRRFVAMPFGVFQQPARFFVFASVPLSPNCRGSARQAGRQFGDRTLAELANARLDAKPFPSQSRTGGASPTASFFVELPETIVVTKLYFHQAAKLGCFLFLKRCNEVNRRAPLNYWQ